METLTKNPCQWRLSTLLSLDTEQVHELACWAAGTLTSYRLVLGRCLLALHESKGYKSFGCSTAAHYGSSVLGITTRAARDYQRVARQIQNLPRLSTLAERGEMSWGKLREIVTVAVPATEEYWITLAGRHDCNTLARLVSLTPPGQIPGDADLEKCCTTEFRIKATPELIQQFRRARRMFCLEQDESLSGADTLEYLLASFFSSQPVDSEVLEEVRKEADKDLQAEQARLIPEVMEAREQAAELGLLEDKAPAKEAEDETAEDLLTQAIGPTICGDSCCSTDYPRGVKSEGDILEELTEALKDWQNTRLRFNPATRHTTKGQKEEILRRDGWCCQTPGCPNQVWLHLHHIKPYSEGGETSRENLICLCAGCHRNLHDGLLKITSGQNGKLVFTNNDGRRLDEQANLELAAWLDFWCGWRGTEDDSHQLRVLSGDWAVF